MIGIAHNSPSSRGLTDSIGGDECPQAFGVEPAIDMGDQFQGDVVNARDIPPTGR